MAFDLRFHLFQASALKRERFELQRCLNELREKNLQRGQLIQERQNFKWGFVSLQYCTSFGYFEYGSERTE